MRTEVEIRIRPITATWKPSLAFQYRCPPSHKRRMAKYLAFRNYKEKLGRPLKFFSDPLASEEIRILRARLSLYESVRAYGWECSAGLELLGFREVE